MLFSELQGKEVIDKTGDAIGVVKDIALSSRGKVTHIIAVPKNTLAQVTGQVMKIPFSDVEAMEDLVLLTVSKEDVSKAE